MELNNKFIIFNGEYSMKIAFKLWGEALENTEELDQLELVAKDNLVDGTMVHLGMLNEKLGLYTRTDVRTVPLRERRSFNATDAEYYKNNNSNPLFTKYGWLDGHIFQIKEIDFYMTVLLRKAYNHFKTKQSAKWNIKQVWTEGQIVKENPERTESKPYLEFHLHSAKGIETAIGFNVYGMECHINSLSPKTYHCPNTFTWIFPRLEKILWEMLREKFNNDFPDDKKLPCLFDGYVVNGASDFSDWDIEHINKYKEILKVSDEKLKKEIEKTYSTNPLLFDKRITN